MLFFLVLRSQVSVSVVPSQLGERGGQSRRWHSGQPRTACQICTNACTHARTHAASSDKGDGHARLPVPIYANAGLLGWMWCVYSVRVRHLMGPERWIYTHLAVIRAEDKQV